MRGHLTTAGAGPVLSLILSRQAASRPALERVSGLSRATIAQRLAVLFEAGLIVEAEATLPSGGRPARTMALNTGFGTVLAADIGESVIRMALTDLAPRVLDQVLVAMDVASGPAAILEAISRGCRDLLARRADWTAPVLGLGLTLPAPVDYDLGRVVGPSVMRAWDDFDIRGVLRRELAIDVFADNDVNLMTLAEHRLMWPDRDDLHFIKAGTGIGSGMIMGGRIYRGARGASGDIGHIQFDAPTAPLCRCGKRGCLEARAAGWAIARDLREAGFEARDARDVMALFDAGVPEAIQGVRGAGRVLGQVAADVVSVLNPAVIVVGGTLARAGEHLLAGIREHVYQRCLPLAVRDLEIVASRMGSDAGILGAAQLVIDEQLKPGTVEGLIEKALEKRAA
ncbi:ROK family protein [Labrys wisconsinensis]|uniref:NBD/HSP70 family sugar kinase n=1 Tax=Labrys wisconsinensis TaxID=425677 RepID=A0ABU0JC83_9HYPH|nr:ROK family protein [Labrys wisconsinensis]MDQ0471195.1 putative NBD/HSP70 family sugar kinase [Labrys wisconsinensis]